MLFARLTQELLTENIVIAQLNIRNVFSHMFDCIFVDQVVMAD